MKYSFLPFFIAGALTVNAQDVKEWLSLTPIPLEKPVLSEVKNVKDKVFTDALFTDYNNVNISDLTPDAGQSENRFHHLQWTIAQTQQDTIVAPENKGSYSLNYYAVYLTNTEWMSGSLNFRIFGNAEIYIDGQKKASVNGSQVTNRNIAHEWIPGKHTILVKTATKGGKVLFATFKADKEFAEAPVEFSLSPKRGKNIYDVLNGKRIGQIALSPSGQYAIVGIQDIIDGKSYHNTYVYRVADKEIVYTFYGNNVHNLQWIPEQDKLSFLQTEGNGQSLYSYDIDKQQQTCLIRKDPRIKNYTWSPDRSYLIYYDSENYSDPKWELRKLDGIQDRQAYFRNRSFLCKYDFATGLHSRLTWET